VQANLLRLEAKQLFVDFIAPAVWRAAESLTVDPVGAVAQSYKETGAGTFGGKVKPQFYNTAGIKVRDVALVKQLTGDPSDDQPLAHQMFPNWEAGALAQAQHLRAYAGWPVAGLIVDPRYTFVVGHTCQTFQELGGKWAPSPTYGVELVEIAGRLRA
jgi:hypothetical protein